MSYHGDFALGKTFDVKFTTMDAGVPTTLSGSPVISAYPDNSTTELTAGITLSVDFDSRTGLNNVRVVATSGNNYATATNYTLVITTGTINGKTAVGYVAGSFSIEARSALRPTAADKTLDVSNTGEAGVDWANVGSPTTTLNLSGTSTKAIEPTVAGRTLDVSTGGETGLDWANIGSPTTTQNLSGTTVKAVTDGVTVATNNDKTGYALSASGVQAIWDALTSVLTTVGSIGKRLADNIDATISSRLATAGYTAPDNSGISAIKAKTDQLAFTIANKVDASIQAAGDFAQAAADKVWASASRTLTSFGTLIADIWAAVIDSSGVTTLLSRLTAGRAANLDNLDVAVSTRSSHTEADVWSNVTRTLTAFGFNVTVGTNNDKTGYALTAVYDPAKTAAQASDAMTLTTGERNSIADTTLDRADAIEIGLTLRQALRLAVAALAGKLSGAATTTVTIRNAVVDSKDRIVATVDADGNRSAITTDVS